MPGKLTVKNSYNKLLADLRREMVDLLEDVLDEKDEFLALRVKEARRNYKFKGGPCN